MLLTVSVGFGRKALCNETDNFLLVCLQICMCVYDVHVHVQRYVPVHACGGQKSVSSVLLSCCKLILGGLVISLNLELLCSTRPRGPLVSISPALGLWECTTVSQIYVAAESRNLSPLAYTASSYCLSHLM